MTSSTLQIHYNTGYTENPKHILVEKLVKEGHISLAEALILLEKDKEIVYLPSPPATLMPYYNPLPTTSPYIY